MLSWGGGGGRAVVEKKKNRRHVKISRSATPLQDRSYRLLKPYIRNLGQENVRKTIENILVLQNYFLLIQSIITGQFNTRATTSHSAKYVWITWGIIKSYILIPLGVLPVGEHTSSLLRCIWITWGIIET